MQRCRLLPKIRCDHTFPLVFGRCSRNVHPSRLHAVDDFLEPNQTLLGMSEDLEISKSSSHTSFSFGQSGGGFRRIRSARWISLSERTFVELQ